MIFMLNQDMSDAIQNDPDWRSLCRAEKRLAKLHDKRRSAATFNALSRVVEAARHLEIDIIDRYMREREDG